MVQLRNRGQAANYRVDVSDAEGESESEENVTVKRTQPARRAAAAKAPANVIESDDDDFVNKPSAKTGLLKYAQKGVSNTKDVKVSRRQGSDVESDEDASDDEESEEEVVPRRRGKESRAAKAPAATRTTRGVKANYKDASSESSEGEIASDEAGDDDSDDENEEENASQEDSEEEEPKAKKGATTAPGFEDFIMNGKPLGAAPKSRPSRKNKIVDESEEEAEAESDGDEEPVAKAAKGRGKGKAAQSASSDDDEEEEEDEEDEEEDGADEAAEEESKENKRPAAKKPAKPKAINADSVDKIVAQCKAEGGALEFCLLLVGHSYRDVVWKPEDWVQKHLSGKLRGWQKRSAREGPAEDFPQEYTVERVIAQRSVRGRPQFLCKWSKLGYAESTWEAEEDLSEPADESQLRRFRRFLGAARDRQAAQAPKAPQEGHSGKDSLRPPEFANGMMLRDYQVDSFRWMVHNFRLRRNVILGDEMGLGKTAQSVAVVEQIRSYEAGQRARKPALIVVPLTTVGHWRREAERWTDMNVVVYTGSADDLRVCADNEFYLKEGKGPRKVRFDALITTYEIVRGNGGRDLRGIQWGAVVADEAHKLKDPSSSTAQAILDLNKQWLLLLSGTPIQNDLKELWGMLHILDQDRYPSWDDFCERARLVPLLRSCVGLPANYNPRDGQVTSQQLEAIREELKPFMLRRMKEDVETIPAKEEVVMWVEMTWEQRAYYKAIFENQAHVLLAGNSKRNLPNMRNLAMELRKVCNHPFLCNGVEDDYREKRRAQAAAAGAAAPDDLELLTKSCGKMVLLRKLLEKLRGEGKKVLIFSQFKMMLNVLEDFLDGLRFPHERIDGDTPQEDRQASIDRFNDPAGGGFAFLLSTRSGGQGITLTAADTAIIYDSDWNPQADLQAMARCHRIGQTKEVRVYRFITKGTYEMQLFATATRKYGLDEAILSGAGGHGGGDPEDDARRLENLLKLGAVEAFQGGGGGEEAAREGAERFCGEDIDTILEKRVERREMASRKGNTFSTATFAAEAEAEAANVSWEELMPEAMAAAREKGANGGDLVVTGKRQRNAVNYSVAELERRAAAGGGEKQGGDKGRRKGGGSSDDNDFVDEDSSSDVEGETADGKRAERKPKGPSKAEGEWSLTAVLNVEDLLIRFGGVVGEAHAKEAVPYKPEEECKEVFWCLRDMIALAAAEPPPLVKPKRGPPKKAAPGADGAAAGGEPRDAQAGLTEEEKAAEKARVEASFERLRAIAKPAFAEKSLNADKTLDRVLSRARRYMERLRERQALVDLIDGAAATAAASRDGGFSEFVKFNLPKVRGGDMSAFPLWERDDDRDLLRGSLRHGWVGAVRQDALNEYFVTIRNDETLRFAAIYGKGALPDKKGEAEGEAGEGAAAAAAAAAAAKEAAAPAPAGDGDVINLTGDDAAPAQPAAAEGAGAAAAATAGGDKRPWPDATTLKKRLLALLQAVSPPQPDQAPRAPKPGAMKMALPLAPSTAAGAALAPARAAAAAAAPAPASVEQGNTSLLTASRSQLETATDSAPEPPPSSRKRAAPDEGAQPPPSARRRAQADAEVTSPSRPRQPEALRSPGRVAQQRQLTFSPSRPAAAGTPGRSRPRGYVVEEGAAAAQAQAQAEGKQETPAKRPAAKTTQVEVSSDSEDFVDHKAKRAKAAEGAAQQAQPASRQLVLSPPTEKGALENTRPGGGLKRDGAPGAAAGRPSAEKPQPPSKPQAKPAAAAPSPTGVGLKLGGPAKAPADKRAMSATEKKVAKDAGAGKTNMKQATLSFFAKPGPKPPAAAAVAPAVVALDD